MQYRLPTTGELIPLLQIAPSKIDKERLLVVSPELADVLAHVISRIRGPLTAVPLVSAYDDYEKVWLPPSPRLFQRRINSENHAFAHSSILKMLTATVTRARLVDPVEGRPLHYSPHDFRRIFITDAILNGLPPHIAQVIAGHQDINVTLGYKKARELRQVGEASGYPRRGAAVGAGLSDVPGQSPDQGICRHHPV